MKKNFRLLVAFICLHLLYLPAGAQHNKHVILVTIDGFRPDFYLEDQWNTPTLHALLQQGVHAYGVNSMFPSMTYPSHTAIVTGVPPAKHGIFYNNMFEPDSAKSQNYWNFHQITSPTIWGIAQSSGLKVASLMWPVSVEAPASFNISDIGGRGKEILEKYAMPQGIIDTLRAGLFDNVANIQFGKDQNVAKIAAWEILRQKPNLMTIHLFSVDHAEHTVGRHGEMVEKAISDADSSIAMIRQAIKDAGIADSTLLIVTGDHGFYDVTTSVSPNVWLARAGLLNSNSDWKARFNALGGSAFLFLRDKGDKETLSQVMNILNTLPEQEKKFVRIISPAEMKKIGADPNAVMAISGLNGASFGGNATGESVKAGRGGTHGYFPDTRNIQTGFIAVGPGLKQNVEIKEMNLCDISALVVKFLGLSMPSGTGKLYPVMFKK